jgi:hypothetical protein
MSPAMFRRDPGVAPPWMAGLGKTKPDPLI